MACCRQTHFDDLIRQCAVSNRNVARTNSIRHKAPSDGEGKVCLLTDRKSPNETLLTFLLRTATDSLTKCTFSTTTASPSPPPPCCRLSVVPAHVIKTYCPNDFILVGCGDFRPVLVYTICVTGSLDVVHTVIIKHAGVSRQSWICVSL